MTNHQLSAQRGNIVVIKWSAMLMFCEKKSAMLSDENQNTWNAWKLLSDWHWYCKPFQWGQCQGVTTGTTGGLCVWQQSQVESCRVEVCDRQWSGCDRPWERRRWNSRGSSIADIGRGSIIIAREDNLGSYSRHICRQTRSTSRF